MPVATAEDDAFNRSECGGIFITSLTSAERIAFAAERSPKLGWPAPAFTRLRRCFRIDEVPHDTSSVWSLVSLLHCAEIVRDHPGQAQLALKNDAAKAIDVLQAATPYELGDAGSTTFSFNLYPVYVREEAFLAAKQGALASAEFQKIIDWRGVVINEPIGALAHLGLARAYVLQGDTVRARAAYQDFLALWKDVDPEIPILNEATAEYDKLK